VQEQEQVKALKTKNAALTQKLDSLRKAKASATRVVKGDTVRHTRLSLLCSPR